MIAHHNARPPEASVLELGAASSLFYAKLLRLAWPIVLARATQAVIGFCDALMVAPLGEEALAAVTTGALNTMAAVVLPMGTVFIVQSFAAQLRGRGETGEALRYAHYGLAFAGAAGVLAALCIPAVPWVFRLFEYAPGLQASMVEYLQIRLLGMAFVVGTEALGNWYGGLGNTRVSMIAGVAAMLVNILGNYALIEPRFGLPGYGVSGAAWASTLASFAGFTLLLGLFALGWGYERVPARRKLTLREFARMLRFGLPNGVNWFLEFAAFTLFINVVVAHLGTTVLAAFNVVMQINSVSFMPAFGVTSAGAILVGESIGERKHALVWPVVKATAVVALIWMASIGAIYLTLPDALLRWFASDSGVGTELIEVGATMLALAALWQVFDALSMTFGEALRAAGDTAWCMAARIVLAWLVFTPAAWVAVLVFDGGVLTVMAALILYLAVLALVLCLRFASGKWKNIELVENEPQLA